MNKPFFIHDDFDSNIEYFETEKEALKYFERIKINLKENGGWPQEVLGGAIKLGVVIAKSRAFGAGVRVSHTASGISVSLDEYGDPAEVELVNIENPLMEMIKRLKTENENLKDRLLLAVELIDGAAKNEINKLEAEHEKLKAILEKPRGANEQI